MAVRGAPMRAFRLLAASLAIGLGVGAFFAGRASVHQARPAPPRESLADAYRAGREDAFSGFDGGWAYGSLYIVTLRRGGPGITYRFERRWPMMPGIEYRVCGGRLCSRRER